MKKLLRITRAKRRAFFLVADAVLISGAMYLSFWLRFDGAIPPTYMSNLKYYIELALAIKLTMLFLHGMYDISWRFFGLKDLLKLFSAVTLSSLVIGLAAMLYKSSAYFPSLPRSVILVDYLLTLGSIGVLRISKRAMVEYLGKSSEDAAAAASAPSSSGRGMPAARSAGTCWSTRNPSISPSAISTTIYRREG